MAALPPLPEDFESHFFRAYNKISEAAERIRGTRSSGIRLHRSSDPNRPREVAEMLVPGHRAGLVIGQHGETLKRLEKMANVSIRFDPHYTKDINDVPHRKCIINGLPEDIEEARKLINERIENKSIDPRFPTVYVSVPINRVGLVIGKGGETIRELQERSGAKVQLVQDSVVDHSSTERFVSITGEQENIAKAKQMIHDIVHQTGRAGAFIPSLGGKGHSATIQVPEAAVGALIGRRAENLKQLQAATATRVFVDTNPSSSGPTRTVTVSGPTPESVAYAQQLIDERVNSHMALIEGTLGIDPNQPGFVYQAPSELLAETTAIYQPQANLAYYGYMQQPDQAAYDQQVAAYYQQYYAAMQQQAPPQ